MFKIFKQTKPLAEDLSMPALSQVFNLWLQDRVRTGAMGSHREFVARSHVRVIISAIGDIDVKRLSKNDILMLRQVLTKNNQPSYARLLLTTLRAALEWASVEAGLINNNPAKGMTRAIVDKRGKRNLRAAVPPQVYEVLLSQSIPSEPVCLLGTGMRPSEVLRLHREDLEQLDGVWVAQIHRNAKTASSIRPVPLPEWIVPKLLSKPSGPLWPELCAPDEKGISKDWARSLNDRLPKGLTSYGIRHMVATWLVSNRCPYEIRHNLLGHSTKSEQDLRYVKSWPIIEMFEWINRMPWLEEK